MLFFFFLTHPLATKMLLFWSFMGGGPSLSIPEPVTFLWGSSELFLEVSSHPGMAVIGVSPSPHLQSSFSDSRSVREPKFSRVTVFSQPTGICKTHLKEVCLLLFQPLIPVYVEFCQKVFTKSGLRKTVFSLWFFFGGRGGISRNVI